MSYATPPEIARNCCAVQVNRVKMSIGKMLMLGFAAGFYISFGAEASVMAAHDATALGLGVQRFLLGSVFSVGLCLVVNSGAELFTGNNLLLIAYLDRKISTGELARSLFWVLVANAAGAVLFAWMYSRTGLHAFNGGLLGAYQLRMAVAKVAAPWDELFFRGLFCNWLVCAAVWMAMAAGDVIGKCVACYIGVMTFVLSNFEHSIANMFYLPAGWLAKSAPGVAEASGLSQAALDSLNWPAIVFGNWVPVLLGNMVGGCLFIATLYWYCYLRQHKPSDALASRPGKAAA